MFGRTALFGNILSRIISAVNGVLGMIPEKKRRSVIYISLGALVFILIVIFWVSIRSCSTPENLIFKEITDIRHGSIGQDEVFLPEEPDFVPKVILERQQRTIWTVDDVMPWWKDPLKNSGEEPWRELIEKTAETILGGVQ